MQENYELVLFAGFEDKKGRTVFSTKPVVNCMCFGINTQVGLRNWSKALTNKYQVRANLMYFEPNSGFGFNFSTNEKNASPDLRTIYVY